MSFTTNIYIWQLNITDFTRKHCYHSSSLIKYKHLQSQKKMFGLDLKIDRSIRRSTTPMLLPGPTIAPPPYFVICHFNICRLASVSECCMSKGYHSPFTSSILPLPNSRNIISYKPINSRVILRFTRYNLKCFLFLVTFQVQKLNCENLN